MIEKIKQIIKSFKRALVDPAIDFLCAGIIGSVVGRTTLFASMLFHAAISGVMIHVLLLIVVISVDVYVHMFTIKNLSELMQFRVFEEMTRFNFNT